MDMDDEGYTIDHLVGVVCVLNNSVEVTVGQNQKTGHLELQTHDGKCYFVVSDVIDATANGSFKLNLASPRGESVHEAMLISQKLFDQQRPKGRR